MLWYGGEISAKILKKKQFLDLYNVWKLCKSI